MSAAAQEPDMVPVSIDCATCEVDFDPTPDPGEARYLAGVHNDLHHGGHDDAVAVAVDTDQVVPESVAGLGWWVSPDIHADAQAQAIPYAGDEDAAGRAWSARVDAAVAGMDVLDQAGLDEWMDTHAQSGEPHVVEAGLVAAWESHVRGLYDTAQIGPDTSTSEIADVVDLAVEWDDVDAL